MTDNFLIQFYLNVIKVLLITTDWHSRERIYRSSRQSQKTCPPNRKATDDIHSRINNLREEMSLIVSSMKQGAIVAEEGEKKFKNQRMYDKTAFICIGFVKFQC